MSTKFTDIQVRMDNLVEDYKSITEEIEEVLALRDAKIEQIKDNCMEKVSKLESNLKFIEAELRVLADQVPQKETKTQSTVSLLSGKVVIKKPKQEPKVADTEKLIEWAKSCAQLDYIDEKVVQSFKWGKLKPNLDIVNGQVVNKLTGEIMTDCIVVEEVPEKVVIK